MQKISLRMAFDLRVAEFGPAPQTLYQAALRYCEWAERNHFHSVSFMEHHATKHGYLPSPIVMASAAAARTRKIDIGLSVLLLPLYQPLKAAEDLAVLDLVSNGRLSLTVGAGYREEEYHQFGLTLKDRPPLMEKGILTLRQAWSGEPFEYEGRIVQILPRPVQPGGPKIVMGGASRAAARRAARIADGFAPLSTKFFDEYREELARLGKAVPPPMPERKSPANFIHVSKDPENTWEQIAPYALQENNEYAAWSMGNKNYPFMPVSNVDELKQTGRYLVLTPEQCIEHALTTGDLYLRPLMGGLNPALAEESLALIENSVLPGLHGLTDSTNID